MLLCSLIQPSLYPCSFLTSCTMSHDTTLASNVCTVLETSASTESNRQGIISFGVGRFKKSLKEEEEKKDEQISSLTVSWQ